jgi:toxin ParE1/3/4
VAEVRWTPQAADDLEGIAEFIGKDSNHYARLFVLDITTAIDRLESFPLCGRVVPEINDPCIREIPFGNYRIVYRWRDPAVEVLTVYHGARLLDPERLA